MNKVSKISLRDGVNSQGQWWWPVDDVGCWNYMWQSPNVPRTISQHVKDRGVVVQAGGNCGFFVKQYAEWFDRVYTFEPDPTNFLCLTLNCDSTNVIKFQACVGNESGGKALNVKPDDVGATHVSNDVEGIIPTMRIDDLNLDRCDLIQLDTEGFEYFGLLGAEKTIEKYRPVVAVEWYEQWAARYSVTLNMIENFLEKYNYKLADTDQSDRIYIQK